MLRKGEKIDAIFASTCFELNECRCEFGAGPLRRPMRLRYYVSRPCHDQYRGEGKKGTTAKFTSRICPPELGTDLRVFLPDVAIFS